MSSTTLGKVAHQCHLAIPGEWICSCWLTGGNEGDLRHSCNGLWLSGEKAMPPPSTPNRGAVPQQRSEEHRARKMGVVGWAPQGKAIFLTYPKLSFHVMPCDFKDIVTQHCHCSQKKFTKRFDDLFKIKFLGKGGWELPSIHHISKYFLILYWTMKWKYGKALASIAWAQEDLLILNKGICLGSQLLRVLMPLYACPTLPATLEPFPFISTEALLPLSFVGIFISGARCRRDLEA